MLHDACTSCVDDLYVGARSTCAEARAPSWASDLHTRSKSSRTHCHHPSVEPVSHGIYMEHHACRHMSLPAQVPGVHNITLVLTDRWQGDYGASASVLVVSPAMQNEHIPCKRATRYSMTRDTCHAMSHAGTVPAGLVPRAADRCPCAPARGSPRWEHAHGWL